MAWVSNCTSDKVVLDDVCNYDIRKVLCPMSGSLCFCYIRFYFWCPNLSDASVIMTCKKCEVLQAYCTLCANFFLLPRLPSCAVQTNQFFFFLRTRTALAHRVDFAAASTSAWSHRCKTRFLHFLLF